jgi:hypothetical protein
MILAPIAIAQRQLSGVASVMATTIARKPKKWPSSALLLVAFARAQLNLVRV